MSDENKTPAFVSSEWPTYVCSECGGKDLSLEGLIRQDESGLYISGLCDSGHYCESCDCEVDIEIETKAQTKGITQ